MSAIEIDPHAHMGDHAQESRVKTKGERDKEQQDESRRRRDNNGFHAV